MHQFEKGEESWSANWLWRASLAVAYRARILHMTFGAHDYGTAREGTVNA